MHERHRRVLLGACFIALAPRVQLGAQGRTPAAIPNTSAGRALGAYVDAAATLDTARLREFVRRYRPEVSLDMNRERMFSEQTGGFDLVTIERSESRHVEFTTRERNTGMVAYGMIDVSDTAEPVIVAFRLLLGVTPESVRIDGDTRARVIAAVTSALDSAYVFPEVAAHMRDTMRVRLARGDYDREVTGFAFAFRLTSDLVGVSRDRHLALDYRPAMAPPTQPRATAGQPRPSPVAPTPSAPRPNAMPNAPMDRAQCGFERVERLSGDIGYLKLNAFADLALCESQATAAMDSMATARALIIDLRDNRGGSPQMVALVASYLFDRRTHLNDLWERPTGRTVESWTRDSVSSRRFGGSKPLYVLTSSRTFSGGEEFAYDLQAQKRGVIVGQTTGGGAHLIAPRRLDEHFTLSVPFARAINPVTHTNWEGRGVEPDVKVDALEALNEAIRRIGRLR
jgi:hypothetical protein